MDRGSALMFCPYCVDGNTLGNDSGWDDTHKSIKRRRHCLSCLYQWSTYEIDSDQVAFLDGLLREEGRSPPLKRDKNQKGDSPTEEKDSI